MNGDILLDPLVPWPVIWGAAGVALLLVGLALWQGLSGWWLRGLAALALLAALANPSLQSEERMGQSDIALILVDESASQSLSDRPAQLAAALDHLAARIGALENMDLRVIRLGDGEGDSGTRAMTALQEALAGEPRSRIAGAILLTDGQVHDMELAPDLPAPLHVLLTGRGEDWDRRLIVRNAPAFAILGEPVALTLRIEDQGVVPPDVAGRAELSISIDGGAPQVFAVPVGQDLQLPVTLERGGMNVLQFEVAAQPGELTDRNNAAVVQINGVRDRLRVLLVSGEPHAGERVWRNLLKSDAAVDLVHFTILRPPEKQDGVPVSELSLIAFPTRELFVEKIEEFDLIIFDRYRRRGILPGAYFDNIRDYVLRGGALLVAAGPEYGSADSIYRTGLADILPGLPSARIIERGFVPQVTDLGARHPVTSGLAEMWSHPDADGDADEGAPWGRWFRLIDLSAQGQVVMSGADDRPLLLLDRAGEGRVATLASDHAWLWGRGHEGGGPQLELLRRLAHWMMKEPELEEEALTATARGQVMTVTRRTLAETAADVTVTAPDGTETVLPLAEIAPGRFVVDWEAPAMGLYRLTDGTLDAVVALGPSAPREFEQTIATPDLLAPVVQATRGGVQRLEDGLPDVRLVREGRSAAGRGWIGLTPREAYLTTDLKVSALLPAWAFLLLAASLAIGAWLREGRR
ncbi:hypothetical protein ACFQXB_02465 [Plastorhodobacter daqingensis]|uniref:Glutamine amidotransferase domain-containing protein n=1 Tax=Plastorhodobacter daqingensis TaxID=1387281 RepID=A0ABW2UEG8_9RHOB